MSSNEKEYYTIEEVGERLGRNRATVYNRMKAIGIKPYKFKLDRKTYIAAADVERLKNVFEKPWLAGEDVRSINATVDYGNGRTEQLFTEQKKEEVFV